MPILQTPQMRGAIFAKPDKPMPYVFQAYPSVRHHPDGRSVTVKDAAEDHALGEEWASSAFPVQVKIPAANPATEPAKADPQAALVALQAKYDILKAHNRAKDTAILELKIELARAKTKAAVPTAPAQRTEEDPEQAPAPDATFTPDPSKKKGK